MTSRLKDIRHVFAGGFATDLGPVSEAPVDEFGRVAIPFLTVAENVFFELSGGPHKIGGAVKLNSVTVESGQEIRGLFDYWKTGTSGSPVQKRVIHAGTKILKEDLDGTFDDLFTGLEDEKIPSYATFDDILIISSDSNVDVPKSWDQTTAQNLAGTPPNFAFSTTHKNRHWAAGVAATPSRLFFSVLLDPEDWVGAGSGSIDIDPDNGDEITAIISHKNELWVFKGPHKGSIHRITGSAPTGGDAFARKTFIEGLGAVAHNSVFRFRDDIGFIWSDGSIHSLNATANFGDFNETALTRNINIFIKNNVVFSRLKQAWAVNDDLAGQVLISMAITGATTNNIILMMDYRFEPVRWAVWNVYTASALAIVLDPTNSDLPTVMVGETDGFVRKINQSDRNIDTTTAIAARSVTPFLHYGRPYAMKTIEAMGVGINPKGDFDFTFSWKTDQGGASSVNINQGSSGAQLGSFTLGTDKLAGGEFVDKFADLEEGGEFRSIQYELSNQGLDEDLEVHSITTILGEDAVSTENN